MGSRLWRGLIFILSNLVFAMNPNSARSLSDASIFSETLPPFDSSASSTDQPIITSPLDQVASPSLFDTSDDSNIDTPESLSWDESKEEDDTNSILNSSFFNNDLIVADSPQPGDCSMTSESLLLPPPAASLGRPRVRRRDSKNKNNNVNNNDPGFCPLQAESSPAPENEDLFPDLPGLRTLRLLPDWDVRVREAAKNRNHNSLCWVYFAGAFPWGVCSSGDIYDVELMQGQMFALALWGVLHLYRVMRATFGK